MGVPGGGYDLFKDALALGAEDPLVLAVIGSGLAQLDDPDAEDALRSAAVQREDLAWEMLERGRQNADPLDLPFPEQVEARLGGGPESARSFLVQELLPGVIRERLMTRP